MLEVYPREPLFRKLKELSVVQSKLPGQTRCVQSKLPGQNRNAEEWKNGRLAVESKDCKRSGDDVRVLCSERIRVLCSERMLSSMRERVLTKGRKGRDDDVRCRLRPPRRKTDFGTSPPKMLVKFSCGCLVLVPVQVLIVLVPVQVLTVYLPVHHP